VDIFNFFKRVQGDDSDRIANARQIAKIFMDLRTKRQL